MTNSRINLLKSVLTLFIALLAFVYAVGDYCSWWDSMTGRTAVLEGYKRLSSGLGFPVELICEGEYEFEALKKLILKNTSNHEFRDSVYVDETGCIGIMGDGRLTPKLPEDWPKSVFVPESAAIIFMLNSSKKKFEGPIIWVCKLGDIKRWVDEEHNRERFFITTGFIGLISLILSFLSFYEYMKVKHRKGRFK